MEDEIYKTFGSTMVCFNMLINVMKSTEPMKSPTVIHRHMKIEMAIVDHGVGGETTETHNKIEI